MGNARTWREGASPFYQALFLLAVVVLVGSVLAGFATSLRIWGLPPVSLDATLFARTLFEEGQYEEAAEEYRLASVMDPARYDMTENLVTIYQRTGDTAALADLYRERTRKRPWEARSHAALGVVLLELGDSEGAVRALDRAHRIAPQLPGIALILGRAHLEAGQLAESERVLRAGLERDPFSANLHAALGSALDRLGRRDEAVREYEAALRLDPRHAKARAHLDAVASPRGSAP